MNAKKGYKVTEVDGNIHTSVVVQYLVRLEGTSPRDYTYIYPSGQWVTQRNGQGPLAVFSSSHLEEAQEFARREAGVGSLPTCVSECEYVESSYHYLWYTIGKEEFPDPDVPAGTRFASRVRRGKTIYVFRNKRMILERVGSRGPLRRLGE